MVATREIFIAAVLLSALARTVAAQAESPEAQQRYFETSVRPVLATNCFECHGPQHQESDLRLDLRAQVLEGAEPLVVPGRPDESRLIAAIRRNGDVKMPPAAQLPDEAVAVLETWVRMGAPWPATDTPAGPDRRAEIKAAAATHWAFQPVRKAMPPSVQNAGHVKSPIDSFIVQALEKAHLQPAPTADRRTLIRRATFDLTGLPPTPEDVAAFLADTASDAWEKVVDRLLTSPQYGERWARHWLDVARYADTKGYILFEDGSFPWAYTYRDYVIRALNEDLPYDQFVRDQIAADRFHTGEDKRALAALGFLTLGNRFVGNAHDVIDDRIDVVTRGLMGLTVSCARCHDHKFDPISMQDYYALYGVMASSVEPVVPPLIDSPPATAEYEAFAQELSAREQKLADYITEKYAQVEQDARKRCGEYLLAAHRLRDKPPTFDFMFIADGNDLNPTLIVRWQAFLERSRRTREPVFAIWHALANVPEAEFSQQAPKILQGLVNADPATELNPLVLQRVLAHPPATMAELATAYADLMHEVDSRAQELSSSAASGTVRTFVDDAARDALLQVFYGMDSPCRLERTPTGDLALLPDRPSQEVRRKLLTAVEEWWSKGTGAPPRAMAVVDRPVPVEPHVFARGNPNNPREAVPRRFLEVLSHGEPRPFVEGSGRLELAQAIADPDNPLTARVMVNRVWMHHFGAGLVRSPGNFGIRGEPPTHPELLDYLTAVFIEDGWSLKKLHRRLLLSATYQQTSFDRPECRQVDPENLLFWRFNRTRLEFEELRDALLFVGGQMNLSLYGAPNDDLVNPDARRRSIYLKIDRLNLPGLLRTFDFANPDSSTPERSQTTVPQQSLFLMNNALVQATARRLPERPDVALQSTFERKVDRLYQLLFARPPREQEMLAARQFLRDANETLWREYAQALLMTNEFTFVD